MASAQQVAAQMVQCPSAAMQQLHAACKNAIRLLQPHTCGQSANAARNTCFSSTSIPLRQSSLHSILHQPSGRLPAPQQQHIQQQLKRLQLRSPSVAGCTRPGPQHQAVQRFKLLQQQAPVAQGSKPGLHALCRQSARIPAQYVSQSVGPASSSVKQLCRAYSSCSSSSKGVAAAGMRLPAGSSSCRWRPWVQQQLACSNSSTSSRLFQQLQHSRSSAAAAGLAAYRAAASNAAAAANLAAALRTAAANSSSALSARAAAAAGWFDSWTLWVDRTSGFLLSSMLNALNLVGNKLPMALGLLLVDMAHNSPLLGGSRADSLQQPYLPDQLPANFYYADGGLAGTSATLDNKQRSGSYTDPRSLLAYLPGFWSEVTAAASAGARLLWLGVIWLPAAVAAPVVLTWGIGREWWLVLLRISLEISGPAFIKWGQWAATRHDLFAQDVCNALEQLHTNAPAHSFRYTCQQLKKSFSLPPKELFDWIEESPIACGSIGQVHRGRLSEKGAALTGCAAGDLVAIKVRHPGVCESIERDFQTMVWLAHVAGQLLPAARALRLDDTLKQFAAPLHEQVDLSREAANLQKFNKNFKRTRAVSFPMPLYPLVSPDVLVESFEAGRHISYYITAPEGSNPYRGRLAELGSGTMLQMMLVDNLIHSDLHPGNILVRLEPPRGLLGLAYKTLSRLGNPDGAAMKVLAKTLNSLQSNSSSEDSSRTQQATAAVTLGQQTSDQALTVSISRSESDRRWTRLPSWRDLKQQVSEFCSIAAEPAAVLSKVQGLVAEITTAWLQPHLVLLDVGMATELTPEDQTNMIGLFRAFAALNGADVAKWTLRFSGTEQACPSPQEFVEDMQVTFEALKKTIAAHQAAEARWYEYQQQKLQQQAQEESADSSSIGDSGTGLVEMPEQFDSGAEALATVLELVRVHGVSLPGHICAVVVTTLILEGWSNKLAPEHSVLNQVRGMFSPALYSWHDRMDSVVDIVMDRGDTAVSLA